MKKALFFVLTIFFSLTLQSQSLIGAWESSAGSTETIKVRTVITFAEGYMVTTSFLKNSGKLINTYGGSWKREGNKIIQSVEFEKLNTQRIGTEMSYQIKVKNGELFINGIKEAWKRIDNGAPGKLQGAWLMSGRVRDGKTQLRNTNRPRKTMKILSGTRFQWIAYNTETKEFKGTGGGTYTTVDGKYTENIEFFSRDDSRVGASLQFDYEFVDGTWHHKGFSSKGAAMHEIWSVRR